MWRSVLGCREMCWGVGVDEGRCWGRVEKRVGVWRR